MEYNVRDFIFIFFSSRDTLFHPTPKEYITDEVHYISNGWKLERTMHR